MKYVLSWSGGVLSTATVVLAHEHGDPLDEIVFVEAMFDVGESGESPELLDFARNVAAPMFRSWGYAVTFLRAEKTFIDCFNRRAKRGPRAGMLYGFLFQQHCSVRHETKFPAVKKYAAELGADDVVRYFGIAAYDVVGARVLDGKSKVSLPVKYGVTEKEARAICEDAGLLPPVHAATECGSCWFCPRRRKCDMLQLLAERPDLFERLRSLEDVPNTINAVWDVFGKRSLTRIRDAANGGAGQMVFDFGC